MKCFPILLFCLVIGLVLSAQGGFYVPLPDANNKGLEDIDSILLRAEKAMLDDLQASNLLAKEAVKISRERGALRREGYGHFFKAMNAMAFGQWLEAEKDFFTAIEVFQQVGDSLSVALGYDRVGYAFRNQGLFAESLKYHLLGLKRREAFEASSLDIGNSYASVGGMYYQLGEYESALLHYRRAFSLREAANDTMSIALSMKGLGRLYRTIAVYDSSQYYLSRSLTLFKKTGSVTHIFDNYKELGLLFRNMGRYEQAEYAFLQGLETAQSLGSKGRVADIYLEMGKLYLAIEEIEKAKKNITKSQEIYQDSRDLEGLQQVHVLLSELAETTGDLEEALALLEISTQYKDTFYTSNSNKRLAELRMSFETEQTEIELENLRKEEAFRTRERNGLFYGVITLILLLAALFYAILLRIKAFRKLLVEKHKADALLKEKETLVENLKNTQTQLVQSEKMASLGQLTAGIAHEINNPINFIASSCVALESDFEELEPHIQKIQEANEESDGIDSEINLVVEEIPQLINSIKRGVTRTQEIVSNLNSFSRKSYGQFEKSNLHGGIDSALTILSNKIKGHIKVHKDYGDIPLVECQLLRINQVFLNLINNAIDAMETNGELFISTVKQEDEVLIKIKDTGVGMSKAKVKRIFEPFYTTKEIGKGTGLGLSISYGIIQNHNGKIAVWSEPGQGSEFTIYLPIHENVALAPTKS